MPTAYAFEPEPAHVYSGHPEHPDRLQQLRPLLGSMGASEIEVRPATRGEIALIHTPALIASNGDACRQDEAIIDFAPTFVTRFSLECALRAAGATLGCVRHVLHG